MRRDREILRSRFSDLGRFFIVYCLAINSMSCYRCWFLAASAIYQPSRHHAILEHDRALSRHFEGATQQTICLGQSLQSSREKHPPSLQDQFPRYHLFHPAYPDPLRLFELMTLVQSRLVRFSRFLSSTHQK